MKTTINNRVEALRLWMRSKGLAAYIFPSTDPHSGEYVPDHWKAREWITGFNGSAGTAVVTLTQAALWTDSRYWLAAEEQLNGTPFSVVRCSSNTASEKELAAWIAQSLEAKGQCVGMDAWVNSKASVERMQHELLHHGFDLQTTWDATVLWEQRPTLPLSPIEIQPMELAGRSVQEKLTSIRAELQNTGADALIVSQLDEIAWTLNLRGSDIHCNPVFVAYMVILPEEVHLYVNPEKLTPEVRAYLDDNHVKVMPYGPIAIQQSLTIQFDPELTNAGIIQALSQHDRKDAHINYHYVYHTSPITLLKAIKNEAEIAGFHRAMLKDGVAMVKFLRQLHPLVESSQTLTEMGVDRMLTALRSEQPGFRDISFDTIAGYGPHAAIVHYEATPETDVPLEPHGLILIDSGAQYQEGTTDITRTIALGPLTYEERLDYTLVLKGHIRLATAVFPKGTTGTQLDVLARYAMWQEHKNYGHGTGHGVGSYLSVHEGPHQFRMNWMPTPLQAGMTITIEPGIYIANSHGVRIENTMLIEEDCEGWLRLTPLTLCPIDTAPIIKEMMLPDEIAYLNSYHTRVRKALLPILSDEKDRAWLIEHTS